MKTQSGIVIERNNPLPALEAFKQLPGVPKQDYESLKRRVDDYINDQFYRRVSDLHMRGHDAVRLMIDSGDPFLSQVVHVSSARDVLSLPNKMKKCRDTESHIYLSYRRFYDDFEAAARDLIDLKENIITRERIAREKEAAAAQVRDEHFRDASSLMTALETHREAYINRAVELVQKQADEVAARLVANDYKLEGLLAGDTKTLMGIKAYKASMEFYRGFCAFDYKDG